MAPDLRAIVLGPKGVGKSRLANILLGKSLDSEEHFIQYNDPSGRRAFGCQYLCRDTDGVSFHLVDTPGIDADTPKSSRNWQNMVHAFDVVGKTVDSFVVILDANNPRSGENVCRFFLEMFGEIAAINTVVVFVESKHSRTRNSERILRVTHRYLQNMLVEGYPMVDGYDLDRQRSIILDHLKRVADGRRYTVEDFKQPQFDFTTKWVEENLSISDDDIQRDSCIDIGVPDILFDRYPEQELLDYISAEHAEPSG